MVVMRRRKIGKVGKEENERDRGERESGAREIEDGGELKTEAPQTTTEEDDDMR